MDGMLTEIIVYGAKFSKSSHPSQQESSLTPFMISSSSQKLDSSASLSKRNLGTKICKNSKEVGQKYKKDWKSLKKKLMRKRI